MTRQFVISPDVNVRNITDWFILNTKVQRMTGEAFHATAYTDFADLHKAYDDEQADLVFANAADTAMLVPRCSPAPGSSASSAGRTGSRRSPARVSGRSPPVSSCRRARRSARAVAASAVADRGVAPVAPAIPASIEHAFATGKWSGGRRFP